MYVAGMDLLEGLRKEGYGVVGLIVPRRPKRARMSPAPDLRPKKKRQEQRVFLEAGEWKALTEIAEFHTLVFELMGHKERVSRNDILEAFLRWARDSYWEDKGGKPASPKDRQEKAKRHAARLLAEAEK